MHILTTTALALLSTLPLASASTPSSLHSLPDTLARRAECSVLGANYMQCPGTTQFCYVPNDAVQGIAGCPANVTTTSASTNDLMTPETCLQVGATCASCYGASFVECPGNAGVCYDPSDPTSACVDTVDSTSNSNSNSTSSNSATMSASSSSTGSRTATTSTRPVASSAGAAGSSTTNAAAATNTIGVGVLGGLALGAVVLL